MLTFTTAELDAWLAALMLPFFRFAALMSTAPVVSHPSVPRRIRLGLALLLAVIVAPTLPPTAAVAPFSPGGVLLIAQQLAVGFAIGLVMQFAFAAVTLAGDLIGLQMGLSFASLVDPQHSEQVPLVGAFLSVVLLLTFVAANGHLIVISALADSFTAFPLRGNGLAHFNVRTLVSGAGTIFASGLLIALPVVASLMVASLALGVLTRTAPQLNLFAVGFPVTLLVGLLMLCLGMPFAMPAMHRLLDVTQALLPH